MKYLSVTIQMKATEKYFPVVLFVMLCKVVLTFKSVYETIKCGHSSEGLLTVLWHLFVDIFQSFCYCYYHDYLS